LRTAIIYARGVVREADGGVALCGEFLCNVWFSGGKEAFAMDVGSPGQYCPESIIYMKEKPNSSWKKKHKMKLGMRECQKTVKSSVRRKPNTRGDIVLNRS
jgi:hypothetical protein